DEPGAPCRADVEAVLTRLHPAGPEDKGRRAQGRPLHVRATDRDRGVDRRQVLAQEPRLRAPGPYLLDTERCAGHEGKCERGPEDLPAALAMRAVDGQHDFTP